MRTIIAGSRTIKWQQHVSDAVNASGFNITKEVCGCAHGVDRMGFNWARINNIPVTFFPAWPDQHKWAMENRLDSEFVAPHIGNEGAAAGFIRNGQMAFYADALVLVWDGKSRGSADMLRRAETLHRKVFVHLV